jgi:hypothetical protein
MLSLKGRLFKVFYFIMSNIFEDSKKYGAEGSEGEENLTPKEEELAEEKELAENDKRNFPYRNPVTGDPITEEEWRNLIANRDAAK